MTDRKTKPTPKPSPTSPTPKPLRYPEAPDAPEDILMWMRFGVAFRDAPDDAALVDIVFRFGEQYPARELELWLAVEWASRYGVR